METRIACSKCDVSELPIGEETSYSCPCGGRYIVKGIDTANVLPSELTSLLALVKTEFVRARRQANDSDDNEERLVKAGEAMAYVDVKLMIAESKTAHYSDCALHNEPAMRIKRCDCGGC